MGTLGYRRVTGGGDLGKHQEGTKPNAVRSDIDEQRERAPYVSMRELLQQLQRDLNKHGWKLQPCLGGDFAGFNVYVSQSPNSALMLTAPGFKHWVRVKPDDARIEGFLERVLAIANSNRMETDDKTRAAQWTSIAKSFIDRPKDGRSDVAMAAMGLSEGQLQRSVTGAKGCYKFVPTVEMFPDNLQNLEVPHLFETLMPEAEAEALMLMLGKSLLGNAGSPTAEGVVPDTKFAALSVLIGVEGGEGKSTLMSGYIGKTLELLGYDTATIDPESNRFSNLWVTSDVAYCDELDDAAHQRLLTQWALLKSVVSGQKRVLVEAKGVQSWEVNPSSQPFFSSNNFNYTWLLKSNGGMIRRYFPLQCYNKEQLEQMYGKDWKKQRLAELWQRRSTELGVTVEALTARVLRYCLDLYLNTCGIVITEGIMRYDWTSSRLEDKLGELRSKFSIQVDMEHGKRLVDALEMVTLAAIHTVESRYQGKVREKLGELSLMPKALHCVIDIWRQGEELPEQLKAMYLPDISNNVRMTWDAQADALHQDIITMKNPAKVWERVIECLTVKGKEWHFQKSHSSYAMRWNTKLLTMPKKLEDIPREVVDGLPELTYSYLKELGQEMLINLNIVKRPTRR